MSAALISSGSAIFVFGVVTGIVLIASIGIQREERELRRTGLVSVTRPAPDRISQRPYRTWAAVHLRAQREQRTGEIAGR
jgi:hypothetical protein